MMEIKVTIESPELVKAITNLANAISGLKGIAPTSEPSTCGDCNSFKPDQVLTSVGKCDTASTFVETARQDCMVAQPMQAPAPVQQQSTYAPTPAPVQQQSTYAPTPAPVQQQYPPVQQIVPTAAPTQAPPQPQPQQPAPTAVPTTAPTYTMDQLAVAATQLVDAGKREDLVNLLSSFGVPALTALSKEHYGEFATKLRSMGAKI